MTTFTLEAASDAVAASLAEVRVEAMRPSLEVAGRFDPVRARRRFLDTFNATDTKIIRWEQEIAGFVVVRKHADHLYLDHLYIAFRFQRRGIGRELIDRLKGEARAQGLPVRLTALKGSPANGFYRSCGFQLVSSDMLDNAYQWLPVTVR